MEYSLCSYSLHRTFDAGEMDIFQYIAWCKKMSFCQLDPWNRHLEAGYSDGAFLDKVRLALDEAGIPCGCLAVDGAHIYEPTAEERLANRQKAYRWLDIAKRLGATQVRIDAGGHKETFEEIFEIVVDGYNDLIQRASQMGMEVLIENHWGPTSIPENLSRLLDAVDGLGLLFDTTNWAEGTHEKGWELCAKYATHSHIKAFSFDESGNEPDWDLPRVISILKDTGYDGVWGIECEPKDGDEFEIIEKTLALMKRELEN